MGAAGPSFPRKREPFSLSSAPFPRKRESTGRTGSQECPGIPGRATKPRSRADHGGYGACTNPGDARMRGDDGWRGNDGFRPTTVALLVAILVAFVAPEVATAQSPETPARSHRHMAVGNVAFLHSWKPMLQAGYLYQISIRRSRVSRDSFGATMVHPPRWYVHVLAAGGWSADADGKGESGLAATGQIGVIHRLLEDAPLTLSRVGVVAQRTFGPDGFGPLARVEFFHGNAAISVGWMRFDGPREDGVVVTVDLLRCILNDLGLVPRCDIL